MALVALAYCSPARGEPEIWTVFTCCSHHFDDSHPSDYEQRNVGIGGEVGTKNLRAVGGVYRNSRRVNSVYFGGAGTVPLKRLDASTIRVGTALVLVSGYEKVDGNGRPSAELRNQPAGGLILVGAWEGPRLGLNLLFVPKVNDNPGVVALQLKYRWRGE